MKKKFFGFEKVHSNQIVLSTLILAFLTPSNLYSQSMIKNNQGGAAAATKKKNSKVAPTKKQPTQFPGAASQQPQPASPAPSAGGLIGSNLPTATLSNLYRRQLTDALSMVRQGQYQSAAPMLHALSRRPEFEAERMQLKYILGVSLMELKLNQIAAFQFVEVIRNGNNRWVKQAIEKLSVVADALGDDTLLNYAITRVRIDEFPVNQRDIVYFRLGEIKQKNGRHPEAVELFSKVSPQSRYFTQALFNRGLALLEMNKTNEALQAFQEIRNARAGAHVTDVNRVAAELAIARTYYQAQDWDNALSIYRNVPRDTEMWHDALFEMTWTALRGAKFRSTLSHLHSLHSPYYEDYWVPESVIVRAIVYLFICKFDETEKTLDLFDKKYAPLLNIMDRLLNSRDGNFYYNELELALSVKHERRPASILKMPLIVANAILEKGDIKRSFEYMRNLNEEKKRLESYRGIIASPLGAYGLKVLGNRYKNTKLSIGERSRNHLQSLRDDLQDFIEQTGFIRYETINGKKESLKKRIAGKEIPKAALDEKVDRDFYVQNGFDYWPFDGEYWLDEIGNYHYIGTQSCE